MKSVSNQLTVAAEIQRNFAQFAELRVNLHAYISKNVSRMRKVSDEETCPWPLDYTVQCSDSL